MERDKGMKGIEARMKEKIRENERVRVKDE